MCAIYLIIIRENKRRQIQVKLKNLQTSFIMQNTIIIAIKLV